MRLRAKVLYKLLTLLGAGLIILIIFFNTVAKQPGTDEFITIIKQNSEEITASSLKRTTGLLNLTNFEYLIANNLCQLYKKELLGKLVKINKEH